MKVNQLFENDKHKEFLEQRQSAKKNLENLHKSLTYITRQIRSSKSPNEHKQLLQRQAEIRQQINKIQLRMEK